MTYMLERPRTQRPFIRADILSQLGETIFFPELKNPKPPVAKPQSSSLACESASYEEDPERWDGMS
jgi:hypothetical protein